MRLHEGRQGSVCKLNVESVFRNVRFQRKCRLCVNPRLKRQTISFSRETRLHVNRRSVLVCVSVCMCTCAYGCGVAWVAQAPAAPGRAPWRQVGTCGRWRWRPRSCAPTALSATGSPAAGLTCQPTSSSSRRTGWDWWSVGRLEGRARGLWCHHSHAQRHCRHCHFKPELGRAKDSGEGDTVALHQAPTHRGGGAFPTGRIKRTSQPVDHLALRTCTHKHTHKHRQTETHTMNQCNN